MGEAAVLGEGDMTCRNLLEVEEGEVAEEVEVEKTE